MLEALEFDFGGSTYKVAEAGLMFAYKIGMENGRIYVVAFSENFGKIIFYIPEETAEKIKERVQELPYSLNDYLFFLIEFKDFEKTLKPYKALGLSMNEAAVAFKELLIGCGMYAQDAAGSLAAFAAAYDENIQAPAPVPNNWLKMHGLPMRRKGKKVEVCGPLQSGHYTAKDGQKVYTKTVFVEDLSFGETKAEEEARILAEKATQAPPAVGTQGFMDIPENIDDDLPFA